MSAYEPFDGNQSEVSRVDALSAIAGMSLEQKKPSRIKKMFPALILAVFFVMLLLALISGVLVYKYVTDTQAQNSTQREGVGLIVNAVRANDTDQAIAVGNGPEGRSLVVLESLDSGTYETRYYLSNGKILQEYSLAGSPYTPEKASEVVDSSTFEFSYSHGLLTVTTDEGTSEVALRSLEGGGRIACPQSQEPIKRPEPPPPS